MSKTTGNYRPHDPALGAIDFTGEKGVTQQSFKDECDINLIMARYEKTGVITHMNQHQGQYADYSNVTDFQSAFDIVRNAESMFLTIPARIRAEFNNDPGQFLQFALEPENRARLVELGLAPQPDQPAVPPTKGPAEAPAAPAAGVPPGA